MEQLESLISDEDVPELAASVGPDRFEAILVFEHTWTTPLRDAIVESGGVLANNSRVPGTASAVVGASANRQPGTQRAASEQQVAKQAVFESQAQPADRQAQMNTVEAQQAAPAPVAAPAAGGGDLMDELTKLVDVKPAGVLTDDELSAAKAKLLA